MRAIGVIPARWSSTRLQGKVLADICGKPMIQHTWERAKQAKLLDDIIIATDSEEVIDAVERFGAKAVYTSKDQPSGTDRISEIVNPLDVNIIVNIQADEPLVHPTMIDALVTALTGDSTVQMATVIKRIEDGREIMNPNVVKVVVDRKGFALYFSRSPIPYIRTSGQHHSILDPASWFFNAHEQVKDKKVFYKHIGIYAYTKDFLFTFTNLPVSPMEETEKLEQLRALENGYRIKTIETIFETVGVDTPEDLEKVKKILQASKI